MSEEGFYHLLVMGVWLTFRSIFCPCAHGNRGKVRFVRCGISDAVAVSTANEVNIDEVVRVWAALGLTERKSARHGAAEEQEPKNLPARKEDLQAGNKQTAMFLLYP
jgi:hypothetical protein